jgi:PAS domain S-box-containing protein
MPFDRLLCNSRRPARAGIVCNVARLPTFVKESFMTAESCDTSPERADLLDLETVVAIAEAIASEIDSERLAEVLLKVALDHADAQRGALFLHGDAGRRCAAQAEASRNGVRIVQDMEASPEASWPASILDLVERNLQSVQLVAASLDGRHGQDPYFLKHGTRSVLCVPLLKRARLAGILYLDKDPAQGAFTSRRFAVLRLVAAQAAIALENSRLYLDLKRENQERQLAEEDIRRTARALTDSEERFRAMAAATSDVIWISEVNPERLLYVNPSFERIWGVSVAALHENVHLWIEGIHPEDRGRVEAAFVEWTSCDGRQPWDIEFRVQQPGGDVRWLHERGFFLNNELGRPRRIGGIATDVTEQRTAVLALQRSEERNAKAMEAARDGHWDWITESDEFYASPRMLEIYGFPTTTRFNGRQDFVDRLPFYPGERATWQAAIDKFFASRDSRIEFDLRLLRDGELRWIATNGLVTRDAQGRPTRYTGSVSDITERKAAEDALRKSEQRFALATEGSSDGIYDWDIGTNMMFLSQRCQQLYGLEPGDSIRPRSEWVARVSFHPEESERQRQLVSDYLEGKIHSYDNEWRVLHPDGTYRWIRIRGVCKRDHLQRAVRIAGSVSDIDGRRRAEAAMQQMQRLEAVGTLAGGVAHDFNNILAVILGFGEASMRHTRPGSRMRRDLERILSAGERGRALVERILAFSRSSVGARIIVNVESVVAESLTMIEAMSPRHLSLDFELGSNDATIIGDPTQVHQIVMNLATNGIQAMANGGALQIRLSCTAVQTERITTTGLLSIGDYVVLSVRDSGTGIDSSILDRIFDPFVTTKDVGTGTGLGLSLVHGIVTELGGAIEVASELGGGSCFTVYLPRNGERMEFEAEVPKPVVRGARKQVLLVDDEEALVHLTSDMLIELGYQPAAFTSAERALAAFVRDPASFDAVITDSRMPRMPGTRLIKALREVRPDVPTLLVSGFLTTAAAADARAAGADFILNKPVSRRRLAAALRAAVNGTTPERETVT